MANIGPSPALRQPNHGGQVDFTVDYRFPSLPIFGLKSGLGYRFVGYYSTTSQLMIRDVFPKAHTEEYMRDHSIYLPVLLTVNFDINDWTLRFLTGPRMSYHISRIGCTVDEKTSTSWYYYKMDSSLYVDYLPFDCTWGAGFGAAYKHLYMETAYNIGLHDRVRPNRVFHDLSSLVSRDFYFIVGYKF